jgi:hypothetical protein
VADGVFCDSPFGYQGYLSSTYEHPRPKAELQAVRAEKYRMFHLKSNPSLLRLDP